MGLRSYLVDDRRHKVHQDCASPDYLMMAFADSMVLILVLTLGNIAEWRGNITAWISIGHIHENDNTLYGEM